MSDTPVVIDPSERFAQMQAKFEALYETVRLESLGTPEEIAGFYAQYSAVADVSEFKTAQDALAHIAELSAEDFQALQGQFTGNPVLAQIETLRGIYTVLEANFSGDELESLGGFARILSDPENGQLRANGTAPSLEMLFGVRTHETGEFIAAANPKFITSSLQSHNILTTHGIYVAIMDEHRSSLPVELVFGTIQEKAREFVAHVQPDHPGDFQILGKSEQNSPNKMTLQEYFGDTGQTGMDQWDRLLVWHSQGAIKIKFPYTQPGLPPEGEAVRMLDFYMFVDEPLRSQYIADGIPSEIVVNHLKAFIEDSVLKKPGSFETNVDCQEMVQAIRGIAGANNGRLPVDVFEKYENRASLETSGDISGAQVRKIHQENKKLAYAVFDMVLDGRIPEDFMLGAYKNMSLQDIIEDSPYSDAIKARAAEMTLADIGKIARGGQDNKYDNIRAYDEKMLARHEAIAIKSLILDGSIPVLGDLASGGPIDRFSTEHLDTLVDNIRGDDRYAELVEARVEDNAGLSAADLKGIETSFAKQMFGVDEIQKLVETLGLGNTVLPDAENPLAFIEACLKQATGRDVKITTPIASRPDVVEFTNLLSSAADHDAPQVSTAPAEKPGRTNWLGRQWTRLRGVDVAADNRTIFTAATGKGRYQRVMADGFDINNVRLSDVAEMARCLNGKIADEAKAGRPLQVTANHNGQQVVQGPVGPQTVV